MQKLVLLCLAAAALPFAAHAGTVTKTKVTSHGTAIASVTKEKCRDASGHFITCAKSKMVSKTKMTPGGPVTKTATTTAERCRDASGHFMKCVQKTKTVAPAAHCRDAKGRMAKCGMPGTKPA